MNVSCHFDFSSVVIQRDQTVTLMVRVTAPPAPPMTRRKRLNLSLVLDRSGSMAGDKLAHAKAAAATIIRNLTPNDRVSVVTYDSQVLTIAEPQAVSDKAGLLSAVERVGSGGTTNLSGGWLAGLGHVQSGFLADGLNRVLLLTDGLANEGITDGGRLCQIAAEHRERGISTTTFGYGAGFNEDLLTALATHAGGAFYFMADPDQAAGTFAEELGELLSVVGQNLVVDVRGRAPARVLAMLNQYPMTPIENGFRLRIGDLFGDEQREIFAELFVPQLPELGPRQVGDVVVELDQVVDPVAHHRFELPLNINVVAPEQAQPAADPRVDLPAALLRVNDVRRELILLIERGQFHEARRRLESARQACEAKGPLPPDVQREFDRIRHELQQAVEREEYGAKRMKEAHYNVTSGKAEYRKRATLDDPQAWGASVRGAAAVLAASHELEDAVQRVDVLRPAMDKLGIRLNTSPLYYAQVRKQMGRSIPAGMISVEDENMLASLAVRSPRERVTQILVGPWTFADRYFSHWRPRERLAIVAAGDFEQAAGLPLAAFVAYESLLHGLRGGYPAYDPQLLMHEQPRGCLFDLCVNRTDIRGKLLRGTVCPECRPRLEQAGIAPDRVQTCLTMIHVLAGGGEGPTAV